MDRPSHRGDYADLAETTARHVRTDEKQHLGMAAGLENSSSARRRWTAQVTGPTMGT